MLIRGIFATSLAIANRASLTTIVSTNQECVCNGGEEDIAYLEEALLGYLQSGQYVEDTRGSMLSEDEYEKLASLLDPSRGVPIDSPVPVNESIEPEQPIPSDDFIVLHAKPQLQNLLDDISISLTTAEDPYSDLGSRISVNLFKISAQADQLSLCETTRCVAWRSLLKQTSLRVSVGLYDSKWESKLDFDSELHPVILSLIESTKSMRVVPEGSKGFVEFALFALPIVAPLAAQCCCDCFQYIWNVRTASTTTTTTTLTTTVNANKEQISLYFITTEANLEVIYQTIDAVRTDTEGAMDRIANVRKLVSEKLVNISVAITKISIIGDLDKKSFDHSASTKAGFEIVDALAAVHSVGDWPTAKETALENILKIQTELLRFAIS
jgi:hypothetical protein